MSTREVDQSAETDLPVPPWGTLDGDNSLGGLLVRPQPTFWLLVVALVVGWVMPAVGPDPVISRVAHGFGIWLITLLAAVRVFRHPLSRLGRCEVSGLVTATPGGVTLLRAGWIPDRPLPSAIALPWPVVPTVMMVGLVVAFGREGSEWFAVAVAAVAQGLIVQTLPVAAVSRQRWVMPLRTIGISVGGYLAVMLQSVWPLTLLAMLLVPAAFHVRRRAMRRWWHAESFRMVGAVAIADRSADLGMTQPDHPALQLWLPREDRLRDFGRAVDGACVAGAVFQMLVLADAADLLAVYRFGLAFLAIVGPLSMMMKELPRCRPSVRIRLLKVAAWLLLAVFAAVCVVTSDAWLPWVLPAVALLVAVTLSGLHPGFARLQTVLARRAEAIRRQPGSRPLPLDVSREVTDPRAVRRAIRQRQREIAKALQNGNRRRGETIGNPHRVPTATNRVSPRRLRVLVVVGSAIVSVAFWGTLMLAGGDGLVVGLPLLFGLVGCLLSFLVEHSLAPIDARQRRARAGWTGQSGERFAPLAFSPRYTAALLIIAAATAAVSTSAAAAVLIAGTAAMLVELSRLLLVLNRTDRRVGIAHDAGLAVLVMLAAALCKATGRWESLAVFGVIPPLLVAVRRPISRAVIGSTIRADLNGPDPVDRRLELVDQLKLTWALAWAWQIERPLRQQTRREAVRLVAVVGAIGVMIAVIPWGGSDSRVLGLLVAWPAVALASGRALRPKSLDPERPWQLPTATLRHPVTWAAVAVAVLIPALLWHVQGELTSAAMSLSIAAAAAVLLIDDAKHRRIVARTLAAPRPRPD